MGEDKSLLTVLLFYKQPGAGCIGVAQGGYERGGVNGRGGIKPKNFQN